MFLFFFISWHYKHSFLAFGLREEDFQIADGIGGELFQEKFLSTSK